MIGFTRILFYFCFISFIGFMLVQEITSVALFALRTASLPAPVCLCSRYDFQCMLMIQILDTRMFAPARHLAFASPLIGQLSDSTGSSYPDFGAWKDMDPSTEDQACFAEQADQLWLQSPLLCPLVGSCHLLVALEQLCNVHIINLTFIFPGDVILL